MRTGLLYIAFVFAVALTVSSGREINSRPDQDTRSCQPLTSYRAIPCIQPVSCISIEAIHPERYFSDIFNGGIFRNPHKARDFTPVEAVTGTNGPARFKVPGHLILVFLLYNNPGADDDHLWNK